MRSSDVLTEEVVRHAREADLLAPGEKVVVAVSAGADSTALASILAGASEHGLPLALFLAHVDHGWRGEDEALADRAALQALARMLSLPIAFAPPPPPGPRTEDAARRWRYSRLDEIARRLGAAKVAVAHHLRDQAETFLLRLLRGSGPVGLGGIPERRPLGEAGVEVVRPLLDVDPARLREHLVARGIPWREDPTNADLSRDRSAVRARLLDLERRDAAATRRLSDLANRLRRRVREHARRVEATVATGVETFSSAGLVTADRPTFRALPSTDLDLALRLLGDRIGAARDGPWFTRRHLERVAGLLEKGGSIDLPRDLHLAVTKDRVLLSRRTLPPFRARLVRTDVSAGSFDLSAFLAGRAPGTAAVDADVLGPRASVRALRASDRFDPLGKTAPASLRVDRWLARRGVPAEVRRGTAVVEGSRGVAWVVGHRIDREHAVTDRTRTVALLRVEDPALPGGSADPTG